MTSNKYNNRTLKSQEIAHNLSTYKRALQWLSIGAFLLPGRKHTKHLIGGFGASDGRQRIETAAAAERWFCGPKEYNIQVCLPSGYRVLDFDDDGLFRKWCDAVPGELQTTYHEATPRGWHVVFRLGDIPARLALIPGVELKKRFMAAPSVVRRDDGGLFRYQSIGTPFDIVAADWRAALETISFFTKQEDSDNNRPWVPGRGTRQVDDNGAGLVDAIKARWSAVDVISRYTELKPPSRDNRWWIGRCMFHDDNNPSMWVDAERDLWGCYAPHCKAHQSGRSHDIINFYSLQHGVTVQDAVRQLAGRLAE